mgnify:CR=1 FL=1
MGLSLQAMHLFSVQFAPVFHSVCSMFLFYTKEGGYAVEKVPAHHSAQSPISFSSSFFLPLANKYLSINYLKMCLFNFLKEFLYI